MIFRQGERFPLVSCTDGRTIVPLLMLMLGARFWGASPIWLWAWVGRRGAEKVAVLEPNFHGDWWTEVPSKRCVCLWTITTRAVVLSSDDLSIRLLFDGQR